jgi:hypothetical protein
MFIIPAQDNASVAHTFVLDTGIMILTLDSARQLFESQIKENPTWLQRNGILIKRLRSMIKNQPRDIDNGEDYAISYSFQVENQTLIIAFSKLRENAMSD